jgi:hypothetical protein
VTAVQLTAEHAVWEKEKVAALAGMYMQVAHHTRLT